MQGIFPENWRTSLLIPILKKGKDPKFAVNYRPISLTNCACKLLERMVNKRLVWTLENKRILNKNQSGFRRKRSTLDNLAFLEHEICEGFSKREYFVSIFFDLEKAYDKVWKYHIIQTFVKLGFKGNMVKFIQNFITDRKFITTISNNQSNPRVLENGVPQGSVLSVTLFLVVFNSIFNCVKLPVKTIAFADDFVIFIRSKRIKFIERKLQESIDRLLEWSNKTGFSFSNKKTVAMFITKRRNHIIKPELFMETLKIEYVSENIFLGLKLNNKLNWTSHCKTIKAKATKKLNILKMLSHPTYGTDRELLLRLHNLLILPVIEYGCSIYASAPSKILSTLDSVHNNGIRISTGAYRTSPTPSLLIDSGQLSLEIRREKQTILYGIKILTMPDHPLFAITSNLLKSNLQNMHKTQSIPYRFKELIRKYYINIPENLNTQIFHLHPPWKNKTIICDLSLAKYKKENTNDLIYRKQFEELKHTTYKNHSHIFTDGSLKNGYTGYAVESNSSNIMHSLNYGTSILAAELFAILKAIELGVSNNSKNVAIWSDSKSAVTSIKNKFSKNPLVQSIQDSLFKSNVNINIIWIPSHVGIPENERVDRLAKSSIDEERDKHFKFLSHDLRHQINKKIELEWERQWLETDTSNKLRFIKDNTQKWSKLNFLTRGESIKLTRLRIGHAVFSHSHLISKAPPLLCQCGESLSVRHIFHVCGVHSETRDNFNITLNSLINEENENVRNIFEFLERIKLLNKI
jgi:ribonuclease HI